MHASLQLLIVSHLLHICTPLNLRHRVEFRQQQMQMQMRQQQQQQISASEANAAPPGFQEPLQLGRYPGQPPMLNDGTEGNNAYYSGNYNPAPDTFGNHNEHTLSRQDVGLHSSEYWQHNPYYSYFQKIWGNAPYLDSNFRLWFKGYFKSFKVPNKARPYQQTKALPSFLHYYGKTYDPLLDPPYQSEYDLFGSGGESSGSETAPPIDGETVKDDCTKSPFKNALGYKRPCGVNEILAKSWTKAKHLLPLNSVLGKNTWWEGGAQGGAGSQRGTTYWTHDKLPDSPAEDGEKPWIGLDNKWSSGWGKDGDPIPKNMPKPPAEGKTPPSFQLGPKKKAEESDAAAPEGR